MSKNELSRRTLLQHGTNAAISAGVLGVAFTGGSAPAAASSLSSEAGAPLKEAVAGVHVPRSRVARAARELVRTASSEVLFNHVMRSYFFGAMLLRHSKVDHDQETFFLACALHDLGLTDRFTGPTERFELDGADAAERFLRDQGVAASRIETVWDAIALHTSPTIAARKKPEIAGVAAGAGVDVSGQGLDKLDPAAVQEVLEAYPRIGFKQNAIDTMVEMCRRKPHAYTAHPFAEVGRRHIPGFAVPTVEDLTRAAPFTD